MIQKFDFDKSGRGTDHWVKRLSRKSMPMVGKVIAELNKLSDDDEADLNHLAEVILRDPALTSHVLKVANSVQYNASGATVNTVSRAIVIIGLKRMRAICISLMLIDALLKSGAKARMFELMAQGFHAATQARAMICQHDEEAAEEVFIAALLVNLGEMAFWASNDPLTHNEKILGDYAVKSEEAASELLGTSFKKITRGLAKQWKLGQTLEESLVPSKNQPLSKKAEAVILGKRISEESLNGWNSPAMKTLLQETARYTYCDPEESLVKLKAQAEVALDVANQFGASNVCRMIPSRHQNYEPPEAPEVKASRIMASDPQLQLNILRELTSTAAEKHNVNTVFQMVIEGMHRGIGLERVAVAFIKQMRVQAKYSLGHGTEKWRSSFDFDIGPFADNVFAHAVEQGAFSWVNNDFFKQHKDIGHKETARVLGGVDCLIFVLEVSGKKPALIYADRSDFGGVITRDHADSFHHFASQAQFNLQVISGRTTQ